MKVAEILSDKAIIVASAVQETVQCFSASKSIQILGFALSNQNSIAVSSTSQINNSENEQ